MRRRYTRRRFLTMTTTTTALLATNSVSTLVYGETQQSRKMSLWYRKPAAAWLEALPLGNGRIGAMVFGGVPQERLQLNEYTVWAGGPHEYTNPNAAAALPEIRRLVFANEWAEAQKRIGETFMSLPVRQQQYQTVGDLLLDFTGHDGVTDYIRELDLDSATTRSTYTADGVLYQRETFITAPDQVLILRLTANQPGRLSFVTRFDCPHEQKSLAALGQDTLALTGASQKVPDIPGQVRFVALVRAISEGGSVQASEAGLTVSGANAVTLLVSIGTSYNSYQDISGDAMARAQKQLETAARKSYDTLRRAHLADYQPRFRKVTLDLEAVVPDLPTDERIARFKEGNDPQLAALYFHFGRYLLISCSRPGGHPATLQGLWNDSLTPPWGCKYTVNINTEMNYWPAGPANLLECYEPLFQMIAEVAESGARTAKAHYGAGGWVCHHNTNGWRGTAPVDSAMYGMWPSGGAWLSLLFWDYYQFTGDINALRKHYPILKGVAQFFLDTLVPDPSGKYRVTCPSLSPEHVHHEGVTVCYGPTMDNQLLRDLFDTCAKVTELLNVDPVFRTKVRAMRATLPPDRIGKAGQIQEWMEDWDMEAPARDHRHLSHLYGLFPSNQITRRGTPDLYAAARKSLEFRGDGKTGWSLAWKINLWARLEDGNHAYQLLSYLLSPERTAPNLFDLHPPFQIDGNFGAVSGICEMLLQSQNGELHLLPALPTAWHSGSVRGLRARNGFEVDLTWAEGQLRMATVLSHLGNECRVRLSEQTTTFATQKQKRYSLDPHLKIG